MAGEQIRKYGIILAVAVLFAIFVFALADAVTPERDYPGVCVEASQDNPEFERPYAPGPEKTNCTELPEPTQEEIDACPGTLRPEYSAGCPSEYVCHCDELTQQYQEREDNITFWVAIILGFIAIVIGMLLPAKNPLNEWVGGGFILGGLITLFIATAQYWRNIHKIARPIVIALELALVLWLAYKKFSDRK